MSLWILLIWHTSGASGLHLFHHLFQDSVEIISILMDLCKIVNKQELIPMLHPKTHCFGFDVKIRCRMEAVTSLYLNVKY
jgi:hypothetical protein